MSSVFNNQNIERMRVNGNEIALAKINGNVVFQKNKLIKTFFGDSTQETTIGKNLFDYAYYYDNYIPPENGNIGRLLYTLKPNTEYTISTNRNSTVGSTTACIFSWSGSEIQKNYISTKNEGILSTSPRTITTDDNGNLVFGLYISGDFKVEESEFESGETWIQIEEGSTATKYEPYTGGKPSPNPDYPQKISSINGVNLKISNGSKELKIPINLQNNILAKVGDYADELQVYLNGDIVLNPKIEKIIFNGSENWIISSLNLEEFSSFYIKNILDYNNGEDDVPMICDYFIQKDFVNWEDLLSESFIENASNTVGIRLPKKIASTLEEFKNWLQSNNIEVYYVLQNSTTIKVDNIKEELNSFGDYSNIEIETTYE